MPDDDLGPLEKLGKEIDYGCGVAKGERKAIWKGGKILLS
jgi:hypothetical protein